MGEPADNALAVRAAVGELCDPHGKGKRKGKGTGKLKGGAEGEGEGEGEGGIGPSLGLSRGRITLSTVAPTPQHFAR